MSHSRIAALTVAWVALVTGLVLATVDQVPEVVATHFGRGGAPNDWMSRGGYALFMLAFCGVLPLAAGSTLMWLPRLRPRWVSLPHGDWWLAPERRDATLLTLTRYGAWLAALTAAFGGAIHWIVIVANRLEPARLPADLFLAVLVAFLVAMGVWGVSFWRRFSRR